MDTINGLSETQVKELLQPPNHEHVVKEGGKLILHHWHVRRRLIEIFGFTGWGEEDLELTLIHESRSREGFFTVAYRARQRLKIYNPDGTVRASYDGAGAWGIGSKMESNLPVWDLHSDVINGARSVAFCRAAKSLGPQFGLALYADDPSDFTVGYSLPHQVPHEYGAGDGEQQELPNQEDKEAS